MTQTRRSRFTTFAAAGIVFLGAPLTAQQDTAIIVQTNAAGDNISLIDPATNTVVGEISGIEVNHGAAAAPDGSRFYISNEVEHTLDFVDAKTLEITHNVPLSGRPNNVAIRSDGRRVYVAIMSSPGAVDVIDTASARRVRSIRTAGGVHNTFMTPDSKYVIAGSIQGRNLTVIDSQSERPVWTLFFDAGVRPMSFETNPDGSTRRIFVQLSNLHGFAVVDFDTRQEIMDRIELPEAPEDERHTEFLQGSPSHGLGVTPDGKMLWLCSKVNSYVYGYSLPGLEYRGGVHVGSHPDWLTFSPDSKHIYVANAGSNTTSVVDIQGMTEVTQIPVGQVPKRVITALVPRANIAGWTRGVRAVPATFHRESARRAPLDYDYFREEVQPIFLNKRPGSARCIVCHASRSLFRLQPLQPEAATWNEEQSRRNYESARRMVVAGNPQSSRLLLVPLAERAGGNSFHPGGKHWANRTDPDWQTLVNWVNGIR
jgi:YVTN family beta-propeller protein